MLHTSLRFAAILHSNEMSKVTKDRIGKVCGGCVLNKSCSGFVLSFQFTFCRNIIYELSRESQLRMENFMKIPEQKSDEITYIYQRLGGKKIGLMNDLVFCSVTVLRSVDDADALFSVALHLSHVLIAELTLVRQLT